MRAFNKDYPIWFPFRGTCLVPTGSITVFDVIVVATLWYTSLAELWFIHTCPYENKQYWKSIQNYSQVKPQVKNSISNFKDKTQNKSSANVVFAIFLTYPTIPIPYVISGWPLKHLPYMHHNNLLLIWNHSQL